MPMVSQIYLKWKLSLSFSDGVCSILRLSVSQANPVLSPVSNGGFSDILQVSQLLRHFLIH